MIILDIETANGNVPEIYESWLVAKRGDKRMTPENAKEKLRGEYALSPLTAQVALIGIATKSQPDKSYEPITMFNDSSGIPYRYKQFGCDGRDEESILLEFWSHFMTLASFEGGVPIVTFNGKTFDLLFLIIRSAINQISIPPAVKGKYKGWLSKYNEETHVDLRNVLTGYQQGKGTLDEFAYRFGLIDSIPPSEGAEIPSWFAEGKFELIKNKNLTDLVKTLGIYLALRDWI